MKISFKACLLSYCISASIAFSPKVSAPNSDVKDSSFFDPAMAQYEAALKAASMSPMSTPDTKPSYSDVSFLQHLDEQQEAMEKYEAALRAALQSASIQSSVNESISSAQKDQDVMSEVVTPQESKLGQGQCWDTLTQEIHDIISDKEAKAGRPLSDDAKDEIIATVIAGSVLGTAVGSPLLVGAFLGYAGSQILKGSSDGDKTLEFLRNAKHQVMSKATAQAKAALAFTQEQWEEDQNLSSLTKKILRAIEENALAVQRDIHDTPTHIVDTVKNAVESEHLHQLPSRSLNAFREFMGSKEVQTISRNTVQAIRDGLESEEMKALKVRATKMVQDAIRSEKN
ncbi:hypothetical protein IV203_004272 [Nitzschia inconspicua]|uniref:Uncharacterized protein n=1 Tax=Nitzschia inconspicua TaxID=303405 RepID=A0A9K3L524_9STRA|nr:hypothetical protein IV203_004272 [Nitzschia inconspicua]